MTTRRTARIAPPTAKRDVRGVALLTAVLVVALTAILVAMMLDDGNTALARTRNVVRAEQADALSLGLERYAIQVLRQERAATGEVDRRNDAWAAPLPPTDVPGGQIRGVLTDLDGRFNLNSLVDGESLDAIAVARFERLLLALELDPSLADAVVDWIDADSVPGARGAEDNAYLALRPSYRAANRPMAHASELRLVRGIDAKAYARLAPHVVALPGRTPLNVNTASEPVLRSLSELMSPGMAKRLAGSSAGWGDVAGFLQELQQLGIVIPSTGLAVKSRYFVARTEMVLDDIPFVATSVIDRERGVVIARSRGSY